MRSFRPTIIVSGLALVLSLGVVAPLRAQSDASPSTLALLDRYLAGEFDAVVSTLATVSDFKSLLEDLTRDGEAWIDKAGPGERDRRELAAVTFALEAARAGQWAAWKDLVRVPVPLCAYWVVSWEPPALLVQWGVDRWRTHKAPTATERLWTLASMAVAERGEDPEFMVPMPNVPECYVRSTIVHALQVRERFPTEPRFQLAQGIAVEWAAPNQARTLFESLKDNADEGGEATMRLGAIALRQRQPDRAVSILAGVESKTRDPWVLYLARFFKGQAYEARAQSPEAIRAYRAALAAMPHAQSASVALASLLFREGRRADASAVIHDMTTADPVPGDPWRSYADADDRFWPELVGALRAEIRK